MAIKKRDVGFALLGGMISELIHRVVGKTPLESIFDVFGSNKKEKLISELIKNIEDITPLEKEELKQLLSDDDVLRIVIGINNPWSSLDNALESRAKERIEEIVAISKETADDLFYLRLSCMWGVNRLNRMNKFLSETPTQEIIAIHKTLVQRHGLLAKGRDIDEFSKILNLYQKAFNLEPRNEDIMEYHAYLAIKIIEKKPREIAATNLYLATVELSKKGGIEATKKYVDFIDRLATESEEEYNEYMQIIYEKYQEDPNRIINAILDAMNLNSFTAQKQILKAM